MKVLIVVTHLLGTGHLSRALTLARAFVAAGHRARVVSGGMPAPQFVSDGIELEQLPPLRSDGTDFSRLLDAEGAVAAPSPAPTCWPPAAMPSRRRCGRFSPTS